MRVRYRKQRRTMLREIIVRLLVEDALIIFIESESQKIIPEPDREAFVADIKEDLEQIDPSRLAGLSVTPEQLQAWLRLHHS